MLNKTAFLSLFSLKSILIFVLSTANNDIPMDLKKRNTHIAYQLWSIMAMTVLCTFLSSSLQAQGYNKAFGTNFEDFGYALTQTEDNGYLLCGRSEGFGGDGDYDIYLIKIDVDGDTIWTKTIDDGHFQGGYEMIATSDGNYVIAGETKLTAALSPDVYLLKIDPQGNKIWSNNYGGVANERGLSVKETADGGFAIAGFTFSYGAGEKDAFLVKTDAQGVEEWTQFYGDIESDEATDLVVTDNGYLLIGTTDNAQTNSNDFFLINANETGDTIWTKTYGGAPGDFGKRILRTIENDGFILAGYTLGSFVSNDIVVIKIDDTGEVIWSKTHQYSPGNLGEIVEDLIYDHDNNGYILAGSAETSAANADMFILKLDVAGDKVFGKVIGPSNDQLEEANGVILASDGGYALIGYNSLFNVSGNDVYFAKTNSEGDLVSNYINGKVAYDLIADCTIDPSDLPLSEWLIVAEGEDQTYYGSTDADGNFSILADTGAYDVSILLKNENWEACVETFNGVTLSSFYDTTYLDFPLHSIIDCPVLETDISTAYIFPCYQGDYTVSYCNDGTITATDSYVEVILDNALTYNNSTATLLSNTDSLYLFEIGDIEAGECGTFEINVTADCDLLSAQAFYASAHIYPDTLCTDTNPNWDGASLAVNGYCDGDSVRFTVQNIGINAMQEALDFVIIEDEIMTLIAPVDLGPAELEDVALEANGSTYRIVTMQPDGHPGNSFPTIAVEGCLNSTGNEEDITTGNVTIFPEDDGDTFVSIDLQEALVEGADAGLRAYPKGLNDTVEVNKDLEYHVYFKNITDVSINRIVIRDTLPQGLDITKVMPGASSHPYEFVSYGNGILKFTFNNINLISGADGFVKFTIAQLPNLPTGTQIQNRMAVYLGEQEPITTNTVTRIVGGELLDFITIDLISSTVHTIPEVTLAAYPNPFTEKLIIEVANKNYETLNLNLYNTNGQLVRQTTSDGNQIELMRDGLPQGSYFFQVWSKGSYLASGKIMVQ